MVTLKVSKEVDVQKEVFFDANPKESSTTITIPDEIKKIAQQLDRKRVTLKHAIEYIKANVTDGDIVVSPGSITITIYTFNDGESKPHSIRIASFH